MNLAARFAWIVAAAFIATCWVEPAQAAKPITGVSCGGGFFVKLRNNSVFWIHGEERTSVYTQGSPIFAMAECGDGVLTVFNSSTDEDQRYDVYHSPDCLSIGAVGESTTKIHSGRLPVTRIVSDQTGVSLWLSDDSVVRSNSCRAREP